MPLNHESRRHRKQAEKFYSAVQRLMSAQMEQGVSSSADAQTKSNFPAARVHVDHWSIVGARSMIMHDARPLLRTMPPVSNLANLVLNNASRREKESERTLQLGGKNLG